MKIRRQRGYYRSFGLMLDRDDFEYEVTLSLWFADITWTWDH